MRCIITPMFLLNSTVTGINLKRFISINHRDLFTMDKLNRLLDIYITYTDQIGQINNGLLDKKIRLPPFPCEISENIVKFVIKNKYGGDNPNWYVKSGDLEHNGLKIEVKGFSSYNTPSSFGPTQSWNMLYFIDCTQFRKKKFKVFEIDIPNTSEVWQNLVINKKDQSTYSHFCNEKKRPKLSFYDIINQIPSDNCKIIFNGNLQTLI